MSTGPDGEQVNVDTLFQQAEAQLTGQPQAAWAFLRTGFAELRGNPGVPLPDVQPQVLARLCAVALAAGIEPDVVREVIRQHGLTAPDAAASLYWPWPVRVHTLGRFAVFCEDEPLTFNGKSPRKALELLQALIAHGGREVHTSVLMQSLWPEESSSNLRNLFDNTLHRLRKLLGPANVLHVANAKLTLDPTLCWVDAWTFNRLTAPCAAALSDGEGGRPGLDESEARAALRLYTGHFLHSETEEPWSLPYRDRLRNRFHRLVRALGERLEQTQQWEAAAEVYERGLEIDNLAEVFYQHLMACHQHMGEHAEALCVYRRCRELLSIVLGVAPSPRTEKLRQASLAVVS
jgi:DNA-binding SARP family transcriptional activator